MHLIVFQNRKNEKNEAKSEKTVPCSQASVKIVKTYVRFMHRIYRFVRKNKLSIFFCSCIRDTDLRAALPQGIGVWTEGAVYETEYYGTQRHTCLEPLYCVLQFSQTMSSSAYVAISSLFVVGSGNLFELERNVIAIADNILYYWI